MAEKSGYAPMPAQEAPMYPQQPPPYVPNEPPPSYGGPEYYANSPPQPFQGYQSAPAAIIGAPTSSGGPPTVVTVVKVGQWGPFPMHVVCPQCNARIMTETTASPGLLTWLLSGALVFVGCWLGCCLIPCCIPECQDIEHRCPNCKAQLGTFRRI